MLNPCKQLRMARVGREGAVPYDTTICCERMMGAGGEPSLREAQGKQNAGAPVITARRGWASKLTSGSELKAERGSHEAQRIHTACGGRNGSCVAGLQRAGGETQVLGFAWNDSGCKAGGTACSAAQVCGKRDGDDREDGDSDELAGDGYGHCGVGASLASDGAGD